MHQSSIKVSHFYSLREKYPNTEFFLVLIFPHSDGIRKDTEYLSVFSPNAGKYGPEKSPYLDTFHAVYCKQRSRFISKHLTLNLKRFIIEYIPMLELLYHKHNPLITTVVYKTNFFKKNYLRL